MTVGTDSRVMRWVRDTCAHCSAENVLVYVIETGELVCANDYRKWRVEHPLEQECDRCGSTGNVWRDPMHRRNEYLCIKCHDPKALFQNRWANKVRQSEPLRPEARPTCAAANYGTECKGEVKYRSAHRMSLCNKHAGRQGVGPNG